jgi:hypothetical protein
MSGYIFTPPAKAYEMKLTYEGALEFLSKGKNEGYRKIGTTVEVTHWHAGQVTVRLYDTIIATILSNGTVAIAEQINSYPRQATTWWVQKVLADNKISGLVGRVAGKYPQAGKAYVRNV